jgi:hypothetical protein
MTNHQTLLDSLESIRKQRNLSIHDLIDGITSERSYRRYRNQQLAMPVSTMLQLLDRLNVTLQDLIVHHQLDNKDVKRVLRFTRYLNRHRYRQADTLVDHIRHTAFDDPFVQRYATLQVHRYDRHLGRIMDGVLTNYIQVHAPIVRENLRHPFALAFLIDVFRLNKEQDKAMVKEFYTLLLDEDLQIREQELFVLSALSFLRYVVESDQVLVKPHMKLYHQIERHATFHKTMTFDAELSFQEAYLARHHGENDEWERKLVHYVMQLVLQGNKAVYEKELRLLSRLCDEDVHDILARQATIMMTNNRIEPEPV